MTDTLIIEEQVVTQGRKFAWGPVFAGGIVATVVIFFLLTLGAGFGLMLVSPQPGEGASLPVFLTLGAIYFLAAQAFGFAVGGHVTGRLMGTVYQREAEENFRVSVHGFLSWAIAVLASLTMVTLVGLSAANTGAATAALYGASMAVEADDDMGGAYVTDRLFRPEGATGGSVDPAARDEAGRIVMTGMAEMRLVDPEDRTRLVQLVAAQSGLTQEAATARVDALDAEMQADLKMAADIARKTASYTSLWIALALLFGAMSAAAAALFARYEKDHTLLGRRVVAV